MADNYLERKMEEHQMRKSASSGGLKRRARLSIDSLLLKNRSCRGYDSSYRVTEEQLTEIIAVNTKIPSAKNRQILRFRPVCGEEAAKVTSFIKLGGALPKLHLPLPGTEPNGYIIIFTTGSNDAWTGVDVGISAQSMLLKAVDMGLNGICIGAFNKEEIKRFDWSGTMEPVLILAIGKSIENIQLLPISEHEDHSYFRKNGVHFVPKVKLQELIIK